MTGGVMTFMSCNFFSDARTSLLWFHLVFFQKEQLHLVLETCHLMPFYALQASFEKIYYTFAEEPYKLYWAKLKEKIFPIVGKWPEHVESREVLCVLPAKILIGSVGVGSKILGEWIRCFYNNAIDRLLVATSRLYMTVGNRCCILIPVK